MAKCLHCKLQHTTMKWLSKQDELDIGEYGAFVGQFVWEAVHGLGDQEIREAFLAGFQAAQEYANLQLRGEKVS